MQGCTENTLNRYRNYLGKIFIYFKGKNIREASAIKADDIRALDVYLQRRGLAEQTIFNYVTVLRAFLNYLEEKELISINPIARVTMPRLPKRILPAFSPDEVHCLLNPCLNARDAALVLCLVDSGCRLLNLLHSMLEILTLKAGL